MRFILAAVVCFALVLKAHCSPAADLKTLKILPIGDSITVGYTDNPKWNVPFTFGYREPLYEKLLAGGYQVHYLGESPEPHNAKFGQPTVAPPPNLASLGQDRHEGYGGARTRDIRARLAGILEKHDPDVILLMIGINDIKRGRRDVPIETMTNLNAIVRAIVDARPSARLVVAQTIPPTTPTPAIGIYNDFIRDTLVPTYAANGYFVTTVDQHQNFLAADGSIDTSLYSNGINHPTEAGYAKMAETWLEGIRALDLKFTADDARKVASESNLIKDAQSPLILKTEKQGTSSFFAHEIHGLTPGDQYRLTFQANSAKTPGASLQITLSHSRTLTTLVPDQFVKPTIADLPYATTFTAAAPTMTLTFEASGPSNPPGEIHLHALTLHPIKSR